MVELLTCMVVLVVVVVVVLVLEKLRQDRDQAAIARALVATEAAVLEVEQTYVSTINAKLSPGEAEEALMRALESAEDNLGPRGMAEQRRLLGAGDEQVEKWLTSLIEAEVGRGK